MAEESSETREGNRFGQTIKGWFRKSRASNNSHPSSADAKPPVPSAFSNWSEKSSRGEPIHFLPNDLFVPDEKAKAEAPPLLRDVPYFRLEDFLKVLPLARRLGKIQKLEALNAIDSGSQGVVFRLKTDNLDLAIKIFFGSGISPAVFEEMLSDTDKPYKSRIYNKYQFPPSNSKVREKVLGEAGAHVVGNIIASDYVNKPQGVLTFSGFPIGLVSAFVEGELTVPHMKQLHHTVAILEAAGISIDFSGNTIRHANDRNRYTLIDLDLINRSAIKQQPDSIGHDFTGFWK